MVTFVDEPTYKRHIVGEIPRFRHKNTVFARGTWDPKFMPLVKKFAMASSMLREEPGYRPEEFALRNAAWHVDRVTAAGDSRGFLSKGLFNGLENWEWTGPVQGFPPPGYQLESKDPAAVSTLVKDAARFFGADLVGITALNPSWVYSHLLEGETETPLELSPECRWVVVMAVEEDYERHRHWGAITGAAVGFGYSRMAIVAGSLGQYIRNLGYKAIAAGNSVALSIPLAIDAGLGELGRNGLLITREYGPRVRLCKVITDLPLAPDKPVDLGVEAFCEDCKKCATYCPSRSVPAGERRAEPLTISNNSGLLKWMVDGERCFQYWAHNGVDCSLCRAVCPWCKPNAWYHRTAVGMAKWGKPARSLLIKLDDLFYPRPNGRR